MLLPLVSKAACCTNTEVTNIRVGSTLDRSLIRDVNPILTYCSTLRRSDQIKPRWYVTANGGTGFAEAAQSNSANAQQQKEQVRRRCRWAHYVEGSHRAITAAVLLSCCAAERPRSTLTLGIVCASTSPRGLFQQRGTFAAGATSSTDDRVL